MEKLTNTTNVTISSIAMKTIVEVIKIVVVGLLSLVKYKDMFHCMFSCGTCEFRLNQISVDSSKLSLT